MNARVFVDWEAILGNGTLEMTPDQRLWYEVLRQAMVDVIDGLRKGKDPTSPQGKHCGTDDFYGAWNWIFSRPCNWHFEWVCDILDANPTTVRNLVDPRGPNRARIFRPKLKRGLKDDSPTKSRLGTTPQPDPDADETDPGGH
jgi:hypothetical protein